VRKRTVCSGSENVASSDQKPVDLVEIVSPLLKPQFDQLEEIEDLNSTGSIILPYGIGIDTHSKFIQVCILIHQKSKIFRVEKDFQTMWPTLLSCKAFIEEVLTNNIPDYQKDSLHYCIESTSVYHYPVIHALGGEPHVVNPLLAGKTKRKTDVLDARTLAYQSLTNIWPKSFFPKPNLINIRCLVSERKRWMRLRVQSSNRINNILLRYGNTPFAKAGFGSYVRPIVEDLSAGRPVSTLTTSDIPIPHESRKVLQDLLISWDNADNKVSKITSEIKKCVKALRFYVGGEEISGSKLLDLITTVPGVGELSALIWLEEIYDIDRFPSSKACAAFCGCDPTLQVSAGKVTSYKGRGGNRTIYSVLLQCASALIQRRNEPFGQWGYRIYTTNKARGWKKACCAVARRLAVALYYVHKRREAFSYEKYNFYKAFKVPEIKIEDMKLGLFVETRLKRLGLTTSLEVVQAYVTDLPKEKGIGEKCLQTIKQWIQENNTGYGLAARSSAEKQRKSPLKIWDKPQAEPERAEKKLYTGF